MYLPAVGTLYTTFNMALSFCAYLLQSFTGNLQAAFVSSNLRHMLFSKHLLNFVDANSPPFLSLLWHLRSECTIRRYAWEIKEEEEEH